MATKEVIEKWLEKYATEAYGLTQVSLLREEFERALEQLLASKDV